MCKMKLENLSSTCFCTTYSNVTIKYGKMLNEYIYECNSLRAEIQKLKTEIQDLKDFIKWTI